MAIIISYPNASAVTLSDQLLGTQFSEENGRNTTKNFSVGEIVNLAVTTVTSNGASGTFETADLQLVTVVDGIITNIEPLG